MSRTYAAPAAISSQAIHRGPRALSISTPSTTRCAPKAARPATQVKSKVCSASRTASSLASPRASGAAGQPERGVEEAERGAEHDGVGQPEPGREQRQVAVDRAEEHPQGPGDDDVDHEDAEEGHGAEAERGLGLLQRGRGAGGVAGLEHRAEREEVGEDRRGRRWRGSRPPPSRRRCGERCWSWAGGGAVVVAAHRGDSPVGIGCRVWRVGQGVTATLPRACPVATWSIALAASCSA